MFNDRTYGLVLGGGGARGGAHIGALKVLHEVGYRPDLIVGTSVGGWIAALLGVGWTPDRLEEYFSPERFSHFSYLDRTGEALLGIGFFDEELQRIFGDTDLRDLSPKVAVMAADIRNQRRVLIDRGSVRHALHATIAVPGVFPAVPCDDMLLVDGGISDNLPTQATFYLGAKRVVAIDLDSNLSAVTFGGASPFSRYFERACYWLLHLSNRQRAFETVVQSYRLSSLTLTRFQLAVFPPDVLIQPDMPDIGLFSTDRIPDTIRAGERAARARANEIRAIMRPFYFRRRPQSVLPQFITTEIC